MDTNVVIVQFAILAVQVLCETGITVTDNLRREIALEVLKVSPVNTVVSPLALRLPLCKLVSVANGEAKTELMSALGISKESQIKNCYSIIRKTLTFSKMAELILHNMIYINDSLSVEPEFTKNSFDECGVYIYKVGFRLRQTAVKFVNRWVASQMLNRVSTLIDEDDIDNSTSMIILSALHFKGTWESPFDLRFTTNKPFRDAKNTVWNVPMMCKLDHFQYLNDETNNVKVLNLRFSSVGSSLTLIMPTRRDGLPALLENLSKDPQMIQNLKKSMQYTLLKINLPKMKIKTYVDWTGFLRQIGINQILNETYSGLERILKNGTQADVPVHVSLAKQKVFLDLDEMGLARKLPASDTSDRAMAEMEQFGDMAEELSFEQPFYFEVSLQAGHTEHVLFSGIYCKPDH